MPTYRRVPQLVGDGQTLPEPLLTNLEGKFDGAEHAAGALQVTQRLLEGGRLQGEASGQDQGTKRAMPVGAGAGLEQMVGDGRRLRTRRRGVAAFERLRRSAVDPAPAGSRQLG